MRGVITARTYMTVDRTFDLTLRGTPSANPSAWMVDQVREGGNVLKIPGMDSFIASDEDGVYAAPARRSISG